MAVYKDNKTGKWYFRVYVDDPITGERIQRERKGYELRRDASDAEAQFINSYKNREVVMSDIFFYDLIDEYLSFEKKRLKETTYVGYIYQIDKHIKPYFGNVKIKSINRLKVDSWYKKIESTNYTYKYKNKLLLRLKAIFNFAEDQYNINIRFLNTFPIFTKGINDVKKQMVIYDLKTFNKFIENTDNDFEKTLFLTMFYTGVRIGELRALTWKDVDFANKSIIINKQITSKIPGKGVKLITTKSESSNRTIYIPNLLVETLNEWFILRKTKNGFKNTWQVFGDMGYVSESRMRRMVTRITQKANIPHIKLHGFRHSYTTMMYNMNIDPKIIQAQTGHSSVQITLDTYTHVSRQQQQKSINKLFDE